MRAKRRPTARGPQKSEVGQMWARVRAEGKARAGVRADADRARIASLVAAGRLAATDLPGDGSPVRLSNPAYPLAGSVDLYLTTGVIVWKSTRLSGLGLATALRRLSIAARA